MEEYALLLFFFMCPVAVVQTLVFTDEPMDTTVCMRRNAIMPCGFRNVSDSVTPHWNISMRRNDGNIVSDEFTISAINGDNDVGNANGLDYIFDTVLGDNMSPDTRLVVGPVDMTDDQSSYQCVFLLPGSGTFRSNTGTLTVTGPPSRINDFPTRDICNTTISGLSWTPSGHPACGSVSYELTISPMDQMIMIMRIIDTSYDITGLTPGTSYNLTVIGSNMAGSVESVMTIRVPNTNDIVPNGVTNLMNTTYSEDTITVTWDAATSPYCGGVLYYIVMISSDEHSNIMNDIVNVTSLNATFPNLMNDTNYDITVTPYNRVVAGMTTTTENIRTSSPVPAQSNNASNNGSNNATNPSINPSFNPTRLSVDDGDDIDIWIIIVIVICVFIVIILWVICTGIAHVCVRKNTGETQTTTVFILRISSMGVGDIFWKTYQWRNKNDSLVQPRSGTLEMKEDKSSAVYASPGGVMVTTPGVTVAVAQEQSLYSYARTGPVNVVMPGGKP